MQKNHIHNTAAAIDIVQNENLNKLLFDIKKYYLL